MSRVVAYLLRFAVIIAGYAFAALAASAFLNLISIGAFDWTAEEAPWVIAGSVLVSIPLAALTLPLPGGRCRRRARICSSKRFAARESR